MEEEGARRRAYKGRGGAGQAGFLANLNEDDEDASDDEVTAPQVQAKQQQYVPREAYDGRAGQRDGPRRHGKPFELSFDGATLLGRRQLRDSQGRIPIDGTPLSKTPINADTIDAPQSPMHY